MMPFPRKGDQADHRSFMLDTIALGSRPHALEAPVPPTLEPFESYDPIVHLDWQTRAACRGMGSDLFFPMSGDAIARLKRICARCPVAEECRTPALDDPSLYGIWLARPYGSVAVCEVKKNWGGDEPARSIRHGTRSFLAARDTSLGLTVRPGQAIGASSIWAAWARALLMLHFKPRRRLP
jgi:WhiB family redox-sensing transcriptional regulator